MATARRPEPQTWLMVIAGVSFGSPALIAACRAGFCPWPAVSTWPRTHVRHLGGIDLGAAQRLLDHDRTQLVRRQRAQAAVERADRRARGR